jgi:hypothetical protein
LPEISVCTGTVSAVPVPFWEIHRNIPKSWHVVNPRVNGPQPTSIHHESTINSPQKHHQKTLSFPKPPAKTPVKSIKKAPATAGTFLFQNPKFSKR